jgi:hypothetical protein
MITFNSFWLVAFSFSVDLNFIRFHFCIHMHKNSVMKVKFFRLLKILQVLELNIDRYKLCGTDNGC